MVGVPVGFASTASAATVELPCQRGCRSGSASAASRFKSGGDAQMLFVSEDVTQRLRGGAGGKGPAQQAAGLPGERAPADLRGAARLARCSIWSAVDLNLMRLKARLKGRCGRAGDPRRHRAVGRQRDAGAARLHLPAASARSRERRIGADFAPLLRGLRAPYRALSVRFDSDGSIDRLMLASAEVRSCASSRRR